MGKNINKINQEQLKYLNEFKIKLKENSKLLEKIRIINERLQDTARNYGNNFNLKDIKIDALNRDIDRLQNTNQESLDTINVLIDVIIKLKDDENNLNIDKTKLEENFNKLKDENDKLEDFIGLYNDIINEDKDGIYNKLDNFKDDMINNMDNLEKKVIDEENNLNARLSKLSDNIKKLTEYKKNLLICLIERLKKKQQKT